MCRHVSVGWRCGIATSVQHTLGRMEAPLLELLNPLLFKVVGLLMKLGTVATGVVCDMAWAASENACDVVGSAVVG